MSSLLAMLIISMIANALLLWSNAASASMSAKNRLTRPTELPAVPGKPTLSAMRTERRQKYAPVTAWTAALPQIVLEELARAAIYANFETRKQELIEAAVKDLPWWKHRKGRLRPESTLGEEAQLELAELERVARTKAAEMLGPAAMDRYGIIANKYPFLATDRAVAVDGILKDYELRKRARIESANGILTGEDKLELQRLKKRGDNELCELLSEKEFALVQSARSEN